MNNNFESVAEMLAEHKWDDASTKLDEITVESDADRVEKIHFEAYLLERRGQWLAAIDKYREALDIDPDHTATLFRLAYLLDLHGEDEEAIALYERCVKEPPAHVNALLNLAILYEDHGRYEDARRLVENVVNHYPNNARARVFLKDLESSLTMYYDEDRERSRQQHDAILDMPVSSFELSVRSRNCLKQMGIHCLGDLLRTTEERLLAYKNFGDTSLNEIVGMLNQRALRLGQLLEEPPSAEASEVEETDADKNTNLNRSVAELELSVRSRKCLQRLGIATLGELIQKSEPELMSIKNFGQTSLEEIQKRLAELGLSLRESNR